MSKESHPYSDASLWGKLHFSVPDAHGEPADVEVPMFIGEDQFRIGRDRDLCQMWISLPDIEHIHLAIHRAGNAIHASSYWVTNHTANGILINGQKVMKVAELFDGSYITLQSHSAADLMSSMIPYLADYYSTFPSALRFSAITAQPFSAMYSIGRYIGSGGYGSVYEARENQNGAVYAAKILTKIGFGKCNNVEGEEDDEAYILKEMFLLQRMHHHKIVALQSVHENDENFYEPKAKTVTVDLCEALQFLDKCNIIHRDIKPEACSVVSCTIISLIIPLQNVLVARVCPLSVKLADFGVAKLVDSGNIVTTVIGTRIYAAPEIYNRESDHGYDNKVDQWSLGVTLFIMLAGDDPFNPSHMLWDDDREAYDDFRVPDWDLVSHASEDGFEDIANPFSKYVTNRASSDTPATKGAKALYSAGP
ncbi:kinase-like protein [Coniophora puteana RWD-64-598 SS2]|uniref:Kinase-like protein n=1 Tax=Coniophora puteana (strain RWD-64-598) TaxID=741705 RepID=A0A5M3N338_CONPW|nr:kinase-like protein [Coniophora puteana RWD-64-598 SS2]EIW85778.1 kinase-like protein [Coniophora puteana RWD-64-598 SS2]